MFRPYRILVSGLFLLGLTLAGRLVGQVIPSGTYISQIITGDSITAGTVILTGGSSLSLPNLSLANSTAFYWQQTGSMSGMTFTLGSSANMRVTGAANSLTLNSSSLSFGSNAYFYVTGVNSALTLAAGTTATGDVSFYTDGSTGTAITNQGTITHTGGSGNIYAANFTNAGSVTATGGTLNLNYPSASYNATNTGTVTADGSGTTVYLRGNFDNNGTVTAQNNGILRYDGTTTTANLGNVVLTGGGRAVLNGTIDNTTTTLNGPTGGVFELLGGTITGGTIASGALGFTTSGGYLDGAILADNLNLSTTSSYVRFVGGADFTGTNATLATGTSLYWGQVGTLSGKTITMASGAYIYVNGVNNGLTLDAATTVTGDVTLYSDGAAGTAITNQGTITHTGGTGQIYAANFTNAGTVTATGGTLYLNYPSAGYNATNAGSVTADGSGTTVYLRGNFDNNGTVTAQNSGILRWDGNNTTANLGNVVLTGGGRAVLNGTIDNTATTLNGPTGGVFELLGGTITGGTIASGALGFTTSGGYLNGATLAGNLNLSTTSSYVRFIGNAGFSGTGAIFANNTGLYWGQAGTLTGKAITMGTGSYVYVNGANNTLTLDAATTVSGTVTLYTDGNAGTAITNQGTINHTSGSGDIYGTNFTNTGAITATGGTLQLGYPTAGYNATNTGTVTADGSGTTVYLRGNFDNNGTVTAQNSGILRWDGNNTTANLGNVVLTGGGRAVFNGTIDNTAATLNAPTGGSYELLGGTITGGTIASGALSFTTSGGYLNGATLAGNLNLSTTSSYVRFIGNAGFSGTGAIFANNTGLYWGQAGTLTGKAITMGTGSYVYVNGANNTLTLDAATTVSGTVTLYTDGNAGTAITNQGTISHTSGSGDIYGTNFTNGGTITATGGTLQLGYPTAGYNATNTGTVTADGSGTTVYLRGNFDNNGTVTAQNSGILRYDGNNTTANLGSVVLTGGGRALLNGTIDNTATTLNAPTGGSYELLGGTITGGTIASGALSYTSSGGYLDGVSLTGDLNLPTSSSYVRLTGGSGFTGSNVTLGTNAGIYWQQVGTLVGKAITQGTNSYIYINGANNTLTLDAATTVTGVVSLYTDGNIGTTITNQGTLTHTSGSGQIYARNFANAGTITATGGTLSLGTTSNGYLAGNNAGGTVQVNGGNVYIYAPAGNPFVNQGTINVQSGSLITGNYLTNGSTGLIKGSGTINGDLTLAGGTLAPGNSIGTLTLVNSDYVVTAPTVFEVEMNGATSDRLTFQNPTSPVDLGAGLLTLSVNLLSAPTAGTNYTIMNISAGGSGFSGYFNGLPNSGDTFIANFSGTNYTLNVVYLANAILLQVPEPSTYALMGAGLALFALRLRRRIFPRNDR